MKKIFGQFNLESQFLAEPHYPLWSTGAMLKLFIDNIFTLTHWSYLSKAAVYLRTSQCPPLAGPTRRIRPSSRNFAICISTARGLNPNRSATSRAESSGKFFKSLWIFSELFSEPTASTAPFHSFRWTVAVNRHSSRSSVKSICGHSSRERIIPEPRPW